MLERFTRSRKQDQFSVESFSGLSSQISTQLLALPEVEAPAGADSGAGADLRNSANSLLDAYGTCWGISSFLTFLMRLEMKQVVAKRIETSVSGIEKIIGEELFQLFICKDIA